MSSLDDINSGYASDKKAYFSDPSNAGKTEADWAGTDTVKGYNGKLIDYYTSNPGELNAGIAQAQGQAGDPSQSAYQPLASARLTALQLAQQKATAPKAPANSAAVGLGAAPTTPATPATPPAPAINPAYVPAPYQVKDDSVESYLPGLLDKSGALMTKARGDAMRTANRRGLQNSSIAAGEGEKAALGVVVPMASQDAAQTAQKNLAAQGFGYNAQLQGQQIQGQTNIASMQITADLQKQQAADAAAMDRLKQQGYSDQQIETMRETNAITVLKAQGFNDQQIETMREASQKELTGATLTSEEKRAADQLNSAKTLQTMSNQQTAYNSAGSMVSNANSTYANYVSSIMSNTNIPIDDRNRMISDAAARRDAEIDLANQLFGTHLTWNTTPETPGSTTATKPSGGGAG